MNYILNKKSGVIHATCKQGLSLKQKDRAMFVTMHEAQKFAKELGKKPVFCKKCDFRNAMQKEIDT